MRDFFHNKRPFGKSGATLPSHLDSRGADNTVFTYETIIASAGMNFEIGQTGWNGEVDAGSHAGMHGALHGQ